MERAVFAGGCFWCTEAIFKRLKGVSEVLSGYTGGELKDPSYERVSTGETGHAEAVQVTFDPKTIPYEKLLEIFFATHNPTTLNRQGADVGSQYRSAIFYTNEKQRELAEKAKKDFGKKKIYDKPIVTEIAPFQNFYTAEEYHQNYYENNKDYPYCRLVIEPKIEKLITKFNQDVKREYKSLD